MYKISKFKEFWAVWRDDELVCICVYKRGGVALVDHLEALMARLAEQERQLTRLRKVLID